MAFKDEWIPQDNTMDADAEVVNMIADAVIENEKELENIPTKTSELINDSNFITERQFTDQSSLFAQELSNLNQQNSQTEQRLEQAELDIASNYENVTLKLSMVDGNVSDLRVRVTVVENALDKVANTLKGNVSGEVIGITDISPIEHNLGVKLSNPDAILKVQGKNLFNNDTSLIKEVIYYDSEGTEFKRYGYEFSLPVGTYTINATAKDDYDGTGYVYGGVADANYVVKQNIRTVVENRFSTQTFTVEDGDKVMIYNGIPLSSTSLQKTKTLFSQLTYQMELGESVTTPYEPYIEPTTYTPNADGTVDNVKSIYPSMTLSTDTSGVLIECEYNKDTNKVIEKLVNAIIALGGNV